MKSTGSMCCRCSGAKIDTSWLTLNGWCMAFKLSCDGYWACNCINRLAAMYLTARLRSTSVTRLIVIPTASAAVRPASMLPLHNSSQWLMVCPGGVMGNVCKFAMGGNGFAVLWTGLEYLKSLVTNILDTLVPQNWAADGSNSSSPKVMSGSNGGWCVPVCPS